MKSLSHLVLNVTALCVLLPLSAQAARCPLPKCTGCVPAHIREAPGIGIDLTTSYGTAAIHQYGDAASSKDIMVPASDEYIEIMTRMSQSTSSTPETWWQRAQRNLNKRLGRPATKDVGIIAELLIELKQAIESFLDQSLESVVVSVPQFPELMREDLHDAIEYAGLKSWTDLSLPYPIMLYSPNAAYAGNGRGLCDNPENIYTCLDAVADGTIAHEQVFAVSFTDATLHTSLSGLDYAYRYTEDIHLASPVLGMNHISDYPSEEIYWTAVRNHLQTLPRSALHAGRPITTLLLLGENGNDPKLAKALREALIELGIPLALPLPSDSAKQENPHKSSDPVIHAAAGMTTDPLYAVARGAALYARIRQEAPWDCLEPEHCKDRNRGIGSSALSKQEPAAVAAAVQRHDQELR